MAFPSALKTRKRQRLNGKAQTIVTTPATTECHLKQPDAKSRKLCQLIRSLLIAQVARRRPSDEATARHGVGCDFDFAFGWVSVT